MGIVASIVISIFMIYKGVDFFTSSNNTIGKTSIAVLNFDNIRKFKDYDWFGERIAGNLSFKLGELSEIKMIDRLQKKAQELLSQNTEYDVINRSHNRSRLGLFLEQRKDLIDLAIFL